MKSKPKVSVFVSATGLQYEGGIAVNPKETGRAIAILRKQAGLTQSSLAVALGITDKAVSKWERGVASPDISLLPRLSVLLNTDIDSLLNGFPTARNQKWKGVLILGENSLVRIYGKPLVYFLLSNFLLVGITDILIIGNKEAEKVLGNGKQWGITLQYSSEYFVTALMANPKFMQSSSMIIYEDFLIYGAGITRRFQAIMANEDGAINITSSTGQSIPISFCTQGGWKRVSHEIRKWKNTEELRRCFAEYFHNEKKMDRGVIFQLIKDNDSLCDANQLIRYIEKNQKENVCDLEEIAISRGLVLKNG